MNQENRNENRRKLLFYLAIAICFVTILIYNFLTPMLSDDLNYSIVVRKAGSAVDLLRQEYQQYMTWKNHCYLQIGRLVL